MPTLAAGLRGAKREASEGVCRRRTRGEQTVLATGTGNQVTYADPPRAHATNGSQSGSQVWQIRNWRPLKDAPLQQVRSVRDRDTGFRAG